MDQPLKRFALIFALLSGFAHGQILGPILMGSPASGGGGGIAFRQACTIKNQQTSVTSWTMSCGTTTAGDAIRIFIAGSGTLTGLTCTGSNTYIFYPGSISTEGFCLALNIAGGAETVTVTFPATQFSVGIGLEFSGIATSSAIDGATNNNQSNTTNTSFSGPSVTTGTANDLILYCGANVSGATSETFTAGSGYTIPASNGQTSVTNQNGFCEYQVVTTATAYTPTVTASVTQSMATYTLALKP